MNRWFTMTSPVFADEEQARITRLLYSSLIACCVVAFLFVLVGIYVLPENVVRWVEIGGTFIFISLICSFLASRGKTVAACLTFLGTAYILFSALAYTGGGSGGLSVVGYLVIILITGLLLGGRAGIVIAIICSATELAFTVLERNQLLPSSYVHQTPLTMWIGHTVFATLIAFFQYVADRGIRTALTKAKDEIAERRAVEEALRRSDDRLQLFAQSTFEGIGFSRDGKVVEVNDQLAQMLGYSPGELTGKSVSDLVAPE